MRKIKTFFLYFNNIINSIFGLIRIKLGIKYSEDKIPHGPYCYKLNRSSDGKLILPPVTKRCKSIVYAGISIRIEPCIYYKTLPNDYNSCKFLGIITDDYIFGDQCKICEIKEDYRDEVKEAREEKLNIILNEKR
jgi:hypothetical protein